MKESDLSAPVSEWLRVRGFEVYAEFPFDYWTADLVGVTDDLVGVRKDQRALSHYVVVELKPSLTELVARQASRSIPFAHEVWVAVATAPAKRGKGWALCEKRGIGVLSCNSGEARRVRGADLHQPSRLLNLRNLAPGGTGGLPTRGRSPAKVVGRAVLAFVRKHPRATWEEIYWGVPNHYAHAKSLAQHQNTSAVNAARKEAFE